MVDVPAVQEIEDPRVGVAHHEDLEGEDQRSIELDREPVLDQRQRQEDEQDVEPDAVDQAVPPELLLQEQLLDLLRLRDAVHQSHG